MFQRAGLLRAFSNSCLDMSELDDENVSDVLETLSPRSRGRRALGFLPSDDDEDEPSIPKTPPGRGQSELHKTFSGSCLELDDLLGGSDPPTPSTFNSGRSSPLQQANGPARQIIDYVHIQNTRRRLIEKNKALTVLVTGAGAPGSGFLATHIIARLLHDGYEVKATIRESCLAQHLVDETKSSSGAKLEVVHGADPQTGSTTNLELALQGVDFVVHCPSLGGGYTGPREGVRRLLTGIGKGYGQVRRVVMTSSASTVHDAAEEVLSEENWNEVAEGEDPITWGRVQAEQEAWDLSQKVGVQFCVIVTTTVVGPSLGGEVSDSMKVIRDLLCSSSYFPFAPRICRNLVDVADVASAHCAALEHPRAAGKRYLVAGSNYTLAEIGQLIKDKFPFLSPPTYNAWDWLTLLMVPLLNPQITRRTLRLQLGYGRAYNTNKVRTELNIAIKSPDTAILETVEDLMLRQEIEHAQEDIPILEQPALHRRRERKSVCGPQQCEQSQSSPLSFHLAAILAVGSAFFFFHHQRRP